MNYWTLIITGKIQFELTLPEIFTIEVVNLMTNNPLKHEILSTPQIPPFQTQNIKNSKNIFLSKSKVHTF